MDGDSQQSELSKLTDRVNSISVDLKRGRNQLESLSDRLLGSIPECKTDTSEKLSPNGILATLENCINVAVCDTAAMNSAINRLCESGAI